jgi:hypothetical protein
MPQICDVGQTASIPLWRKACCGFFRPENLTASTGFEPTILGTRGQHDNPKTTEAALRNVSQLHFFNFSYTDTKFVMVTVRILFITNWYDFCRRGIKQIDPLQPVTLRTRHTYHQRTHDRHSVNKHTNRIPWVMLCNMFPPQKFHAFHNVIHSSSSNIQVSRKRNTTI